MYIEKHRRNYTEDTGRTVSTRMKEHQNAVGLKHITQSALAEHYPERGRRILFNETSVLAKTSVLTSLENTGGNR